MKDRFSILAPYIIVFCAALSLLSQTALANTIWVSPTAPITLEPCGATRDVACHIIKAVQISTNGDVLLLTTGNYTTTNILVDQKAITIQAEIIGEVIFHPQPPFDLTLKPYDYVFLFANCTSTVKGLRFEQSTMTAVKVLGVSTSKMVFDTCTFSNNVQPLYKDFAPTVVMGGAVYADGGVEFANCLFEGNAAYGALRERRPQWGVAGASAQGGAIAVLSSCDPGAFSIVINSCRFKGNVVMSSQLTGAEYALGASLSVYQNNECIGDWRATKRFVKISNSTFDGDILGQGVTSTYLLMSGKLGGASVSILSEWDIDLNITNSQFTNAHMIPWNALNYGANSEGGFIRLELPSVTSSVSIDNCKFINGSGRASGSSDYVAGYGGFCRGGAVFFTGSCPLKISDTRFENNVCESGDGGSLSGSAIGGAVYVRGDPEIYAIFRNPSHIIFEDCQFENNRVQLAPQVFRLNSTIRQVGPLLGGAVAIDIAHDFDDVVLIEQCQFINNTVVAPPGGGAIGGAISFRDESSSWGGQNMRFTIRKSKFEHNHALGGTQPREGGNAFGGAVAVMTAYVSQNNTVFLETEFSGNSAIGGLCNAAGCRAGTSAGGALYFGSRAIENRIPNCKSCDSILVSSCSFSKNSAGSPLVQEQSSGFIAGGSIYVDDPSPTMNIAFAEFSQNIVFCNGKRSTCAGGGIYAPKTTVRSAQFINNGVRTVSDDDTFETFAIGEGGAVASTENLKISATVFSQNTVRVSSAVGGAIFASKSLTLSDVEFDVDNTAHGSQSGRGGAVAFDGVEQSLNTINLLGVTFRGNTAETAKATGGAYGGCLSLKVGPTTALLFSGVHFTACTASYGAGVAIQFIDSPESWNVTAYTNQISFTRGLAQNAGGAVFLQTVSEEMNMIFQRAFCNSSDIDFEFNIASWGSDCATPPVALQILRSPPRYVWPVEKFAVFVGIVDNLGNLAKIPDATVAASVPYDKNIFLKTGLMRDQTGADEHGMFKFSHTSLLGKVGSNATIQFVSSDAGPFILLTETERINIISCPPGYYLPFPDATECARCPPFTYNFGQSSTCESCLVNKKSQFLLALDSDSNDTETASSCLVPAEDSQDQLWEIAEGFYPTASSFAGVAPTKLLECPNSEACLGFSCSLYTENSEWRANCSLCAGNQTQSSSDCHCRTGYTDRLCTRCSCDPNKDCWFQNGDDEFECRKCKTPSTAALVGAIVVLQLSLIIFLVFKRSAIALFIAEGIIVFIFIILGLSEWFFVDLFVLLGIMLLISQSSRRSKRHHAHNSFEDDLKSEHADDEHHEIARLAGIVKIFLFWAQTTTAVIPTTAWPHWFHNLIQQLSSISLRVSGLECFAPSILSNPVWKFGFVMAMPWMLSFAILIAASVAWVVKRLQLKRGISNAVRRMCGIPERSRMSVAPDSEGEADALLSGGYDSDSVPGSAPAMSASAASQSPLAAKILYCILFLLFASHFELCIAVLKILKPCQDGYMVALPWIPCDSSVSSSFSSLMILGYIFLFLYLLGIPILFGVLLLRNRRELQSPNVEAKIGFLYESYKPSIWWFEMVWLARRILLSVIIVLVPDTSVFRAGGVITVLIASAFIQRRWRPFASNFANTMELFATVCIIYSLVISRELAYWFQTATDVSSYGAAMTSESLQTVIFVVNAAVVVILAGAVVIPALRAFLLKFEFCRRKIALLKRKFHVEDEPSKLLESE
eukprot:TRINITY_DN9809_c0_g1_i1.p1 TRINITY_DN9809_c0_g1~~TRINITY_DN9809_c0_g1_i1.p1  ORF type:complete len:1715 (-),score=214.35 TRINITY_DN9809_c0_g1_i1:28-5172(-)